MTRIQRDQSPNPSTILSSSSSMSQATTPAAPAFQTSVPMHLRQPPKKEEALPEQDQDEPRPQENQNEDQSDSRSRRLCPKAKLRIHIEDLTHDAIPTFTRVVPLGSLITDAIICVQAHLFTPPSQTSRGQAPPHQRPMPPGHEKWTPQEVRSVTLIIRSMDGVAYTTGTELDEAHKEIHLSLDYIQARIKQFYGENKSGGSHHKADASLLHEIRGVVTHEMVHVFQHDGKGTWPGGLTEGVADYVRMKSGLGAEHWSPWPAGKRTRGDKYDEGYQKTAWFLQWVEDNVGGPGCIGRLNEAIRTRKWEDGKVWESVMGKSVGDCWSLYKDDWGNMNKEHEN